MRTCLFWNSRLSPNQKRMASSAKKEDSWKAFPWHHGNIPRMECQTKLEKAFLSSVKVAGRPVNTWLVRLSRNNEQTISICFAKKKVHEGREQDRYTLDPTVTPVAKFQHYIVHQAEGTGRYYLVRGREFGDIYQLVDHYKKHPLFIGGTESSGDRGDIPFLSGNMVHRDLMCHDEAVKEEDDDDEYGSEISDTDEEDSSGSEIQEDDIFDEYEEEEESREIPFLVTETENSRKVEEEEGEDDFPDTASIIYGERAEYSQSTTEINEEDGATSTQEETTSPSLKTIGQACMAVTQKVTDRIRPKQDEDGLISDRKYGDLDEDPDREKLAKEMMPHLEKEKQKAVKTQKSLEEKKSKEKSQDEPKKEDRYEDVEMEEAYTNRRSTSTRLLPVTPKRPTSKPPQPSPRTSGPLNISQQEEDDLAKAIKLSLQESGSPQDASPDAKKTVTVDRKVSAPTTTAIPTIATTPTESSPVSQLAQLEREQMIRQGEQDGIRKTKSPNLEQENQVGGYVEMNVENRPTPAKRQFGNRLSPDLSTISEETSGCLSRNSSVRRNIHMDEDNEEDGTAFEPRRSLKYLPSDITSYIESCQNETRDQERRQNYVKNLNVILKEIEQISKQVNKTRDDLRSLEGRMDGLTSTLKQMILNEQLEQDHYRMDDDALSTISSLSNTTLTDANERQNGEIDDEIDDIYKMIGGGPILDSSKGLVGANTTNASPQGNPASSPAMNGKTQSHDKTKNVVSNTDQGQIRSPNRPSTPSRGSQLIVVKPYQPQYFDEMDIKEGDVIAFMDELEDGWWRGMKLGNPSPVGVFPSAYVRMAESLGARPKLR